MIESPISSSSRRPLSPHLTIYRWQITMALSIVHRLTGVALSAGSALLAVWLWGAAYSQDTYRLLQDFFATLPGQIVLIGWAFALYLHLATGIRHLFWDIGVGYAVPTARRTGWGAVFFAILLTLLTVLCVYRRMSL